MARADVERADAEVVVDIVRQLRSLGVNNHRPTVRSAIAIASILSRRSAHARINDEVFNWACGDVLSLETLKVTRGGESQMQKKIGEVIRRVCAAANAG